MGCAGCTLGTVNRVGLQVRVIGGEAPFSLRSYKKGQR